MIDEKDLIPAEETAEEETAAEELPQTDNDFTDELDDEEAGFIEHIPEADDSNPQPEAESEETPPENTDDGRGKAILEGLLFIVGDDGITLEQAAAALDISEEKAAALFDSLMVDYLDDSRGIEIGHFGNTYRFLSKSVVHEYAKKLFQMDKQATLSQAALETLAIIAYKQPITRVEIEEIRGVGADMMLRKLMARDLIKESGRSEAPGRPILYEVTEEFLNSFKLLSLSELPELPQFEESEQNDDLFEFSEKKSD